MLRPLVIVALCALCALSGAASAEPIYKCTVGGKPAYSDRPCADGGGGRLAVPAAPLPDPDGERELQRQKTLLTQLQRERGAREAAEARTARLEARGNQAANARRQRCAKMRQQQRWAEEDAWRAAGPGRDAAQRKAYRHAQSVKLACPA